MTATRRTVLTAIGTAAGAGSVGAGSSVAQAEPRVEMITDGDAYYFDPIGLSVEPGTTVTFENVAGSHNSVAYTDRIPSGADAWETSIGETAEHTFEEPGTYDYYCAPHKTLGMVGRIVVGEPGGPAEGSTPPDGDIPASDTIVSEGAVSYEAFTEGGGSGGPLLLGAGTLAGMTGLAGVVYWLANSEGEPERVGSRAWHRRHGLE